MAGAERSRYPLFSSRATSSCCPRMAPPLNGSSTTGLSAASSTRTRKCPGKAHAARAHARATTRPPRRRTTASEMGMPTRRGEDVVEERVLGFVIVLSVSAKPAGEPEVDRRARACALPGRAATFRRESGSASSSIRRGGRRLGRARGTRRLRSRCPVEEGRAHRRAEPHRLRKSAPMSVSRVLRMLCEDAKLELRGSALEERARGLFLYVKGNTAVRVERHHDPRCACLLAR